MIHTKIRKSTEKEYFVFYTNVKKTKSVKDLFSVVESELVRLYSALGYNDVICTFMARLSKVRVSSTIDNFEKIDLFDIHWHEILSKKESFLNYKVAIFHEKTNYKES